MAELCVLEGGRMPFQEAEFLLHKYKRMIKSEFRTSNTLLNSAEYVMKREELFCFLA
jgi:hypothetical protein